MLDPKTLRQDLDVVAANLARRGFKLDRERYLALETERKELQMRVESLRQTRNERSKAIGRAKAAGGDVEALKREVGTLGEEQAGAEARLVTLTAELDDFLARLPNTLHASVPHGGDSSANVEVRRCRHSPAVLVRAAGSRRARREARAHRFRRRGETFGCPLRRAQRCGRATASRNRAADAGSCTRASMATPKRTSLIS